MIKYNIKPLPRYRLYTNLEKYFLFIKDILLKKSNLGDDIFKFENEVKGLTAAPYAVAMPQNRVGTYLTLKLLIRPGSKVIMSPYTIHDVVNMVICAGGIPVFVDIDRKTCNLDLKLVEDHIDKETGAILITHMLGLTMDIRRLAEICKKKGIVLVEDVAQAFGAVLNGKMAGTFGDAGIYSFGMYKNLNTFLGGMIITSRQDLFSKISDEIISYPVQKLGPLLKKVFLSFITDVATYPPFFKLIVFDLFRYGFLKNVNFINRRVSVENEAKCKLEIPLDYLCRMSPLQARLGLQALSGLQSDNFARVAFAKKYHDGLNDIDDLILPPLKEDLSHIYYYFPLQYKKRHDLIKHMMVKGCDVGEQHIKNCADLECFEEFHRNCPNARSVSNETILLPTYPRYSFDEVDRNVRAIRSFFKT